MRCRLLDGHDLAKREHVLFDVYRRDLAELERDLGVTRAWYRSPRRIFGSPWARRAIAAAAGATA